MLNGCNHLRELTGQDYGYQLEDWRDYLLNNEELGYTHPYASKAVDLAILEISKNNERAMLFINWEQRGKEYLEKLLSSPQFPIHENSRKAIPEQSGVYRIFKTRNPQTTLYIGKSQNLRSRIFGKRIKRLVDRQTNENIQLQFLLMTDTEWNWFVEFAKETLKPQFPE